MKVTALVSIVFLVSTSVHCVANNPSNWYLAGSASQSGEYVMRYLAPTGWMIFRSCGSSNENVTNSLYRMDWECPPTYAYVSDSGTSVIGIDRGHTSGLGKNIVAVYRKGQERFAFSDEEILGEDDVKNDDYPRQISMSKRPWAMKCNMFFGKDDGQEQFYIWQRWNKTWVVINCESGTLSRKSTDDLPRPVVAEGAVLAGRIIAQMDKPVGSILHGVLKQDFEAIDNNFPWWWEDDWCRTAFSYVSHVELLLIKPVKHDVEF